MKLDTRAVLLALLTLGLAASSKAGPGGCLPNENYLSPFAYEEIDVSSTAKVLTVATAFPTGEKGADMAIVQVEDDAVRYRDDGIAPTATVGMLMAVNTTVTICGEASLRKVQFIRVTNDADLNVQYYRAGGQ